MRTLRSVLGSLARSPFKSSITLATVGLGVGVLIFALSISTAFNRLIAQNLERNGRVVMVANARWDQAGALESVKPFQFDRRAPVALLHGVVGARAASPVTETSWTDFQTERGTYQIRSVLGVGESYLEVMGLDLVIGSPITAAAMAAGERHALISATLAVLLFGSPVDAVGQIVRPPMPDVSIQGGEELQGAVVAMLRDLLSPPITVGGVFADPSELQRRAYGVADMEEARSTVRTFSLVVNLLGFVLLGTGHADRRGDPRLNYRVRSSTYVINDGMPATQTTGGSCPGGLQI